MPTIRVFEGPLCCNTGVCGVDVDQALVDFTDDVHWAIRQGADVVRANLAQDPVAFSHNPVALQFLRSVGVEGLPLVLVDGLTAVAGRYPTRDELARFSGVTAAPTVTLPLTLASSCCGGDSPTDGCCDR